MILLSCIFYQLLNNQNITFVTFRKPVRNLVMKVKGFSTIADNLQKGVEGPVWLASVEPSCLVQAQHTTLWRESGLINFMPSGCEHGNFPFLLDIVDLHSEVSVRERVDTLQSQLCLYSNEGVLYFNFISNLAKLLISL